jgi:hypothetical protein
VDTAIALDQIGPRGSCTDAERRAARTLARALKDAGRRPRVETIWVRPQWPWIWLVHAALGIAGSVVSIDAPEVGLAICAVAAVSAILQLTGRLPGLSMLWPRRATQNVVARDPRDAPVRLIVTAAYDTPRGQAATLRLGARLLGERAPHPLALLTLALVTLTGCAIARVAGADQTTLLGAIQLVPTVACIVATAMLTDAALSKPADGDASAVDTVLKLVRTLDRMPPRNLAVDVVLAGASDGPSLGMRSYVRTQAVNPEEVAVLHLEPSEPDVWTHEGPLIAWALHPRLVELAQAPTHKRHAMSGAYRARQRRWPAIAIGASPERALQLVARLDADLGKRA